MVRDPSGGELCCRTTSLPISTTERSGHFSLRNEATLQKMWRRVISRCHHRYGDRVPLQSNNEKAHPSAFAVGGAKLRTSRSEKPYVFWKKQRPEIPEQKVPDFYRSDGCFLLAEMGVGRPRHCRATYEPSISDLAPIIGGGNAAIKQH